MKNGSELSVNKLGSTKSNLPKSGLRRLMVFAPNHKPRFAPRPTRHNHIDSTQVFAHMLADLSR